MNDMDKTLDDANIQMDQDVGLFMCTLLEYFDILCPKYTSTKTGLVLINYVLFVCRNAILPMKLDHIRM